LTSSWGLLSRLGELVVGRYAGGDLSRKFETV
jgi:hypothetical protein